MKPKHFIIAGLTLLGCVGLLGLSFLYVQGTRDEEGIGTLAGLSTVFLGLPGLLLLLYGIVAIRAVRR